MDIISHQSNLMLYFISYVFYRNMDHEKVLKDILQKVADEQKYENCEINFNKTSSGGANYTSQLYLATISSPDKDDLRLFAKIAAIGDKMRSATPIRIYQIETYFYKKIKKIYEDLEEKHRVPSEHRIVTAKFYAADDESYKEALVLEDLTVAGYQSYDRFKTFTWEYAKKSVINLAKLHALSIAWSVYDPITFEESADVLKTEHNIEVMMDYFQNVVKIGLEVTREENKERFQKFIEHISGDEHFHKFQKPLRRPVVAYGDYRPSNLMHKEHEVHKICYVFLGVNDVTFSCFTLYKKYVNTLSSPFSAKFLDRAALCLVFLTDRGSGNIFFPE